MGRILNIAITVVVAGLQSGCGFGVAEVADIIDRSDPKARTHLELQIKQAIFCELKKGAFDARTENSVRRFHQQSEVTSPDDGPFPDTWGAQVSFNLTTDETSTLTPGVTLNYPRVPGVSNAGAVGRSFNFGFGGTLSTQNVNYDKYDFYWTAAQLTAGGEKCNPMDFEIVGGLPAKEQPFYTVPFYSGDAGVQPTECHAASEGGFVALGHSACPFNYLATRFPVGELKRGSGLGDIWFHSDRVSVDLEAE